MAAVENCELDTRIKYAPITVPLYLKMGELSIDSGEDT